MDPISLIYENMHQKSYTIWLRPASHDSIYDAIDCIVYAEQEIGIYDSTPYRKEGDTILLPGFTQKSIAEAALKELWKQGFAGSGISYGIIDEEEVRLKKKYGDETGATLHEL